MPSLAVDNSNITTLQTQRELYQDYLGGGKEALLDTLTKYAYVIYKLRELGSSENDIKRYVGEPLFSLVEPLSRIDDVD